VNAVITDPSLECCRITFEKLAVREESSAGALAEQAIGQTFLPSHLSQAEADRPAVVAAATMAALQQQAAFAREVRPFLTCTPAF